MKMENKPSQNTNHLDMDSKYLWPTCPSSPLHVAICTQMLLHKHNYIFILYLCAMNRTEGQSVPDNLCRCRESVLLNGNRSMQECYKYWSKSLITVLFIFFYFEIRKKITSYYRKVKKLFDGSIVQHSQQNCKLFSFKTFIIMIY